MRFKAVPACYLVFRREGKVLLLLRKGTAYYPGYWSMPSGHVEQGESLKECAIRECFEETGLKLTKSNLKLVHVLNRPAVEEPTDTRLDFFYEVTKWHGEPQNTEPNKCAALEWHSPDSLPKNMIPEIEHVIKCLGNGQFESEFDWNRKT